MAFEVASSAKSNVTTLFFAIDMEVVLSEARSFLSLKMKPRSKFFELFVPKMQISSEVYLYIRYKTKKGEYLCPRIDASQGQDDDEPRLTIPPSTGNI